MAQRKGDAGGWGGVGEMKKSDSLLGIGDGDWDWDWGWGEGGGGLCFAHMNPFTLPTTLARFIYFFCSSIMCFTASLPPFLMIGFSFLFFGGGGVFWALFSCRRRSYESTGSVPSWREGFGILVIGKKSRFDKVSIESGPLSHPVPSHPIPSHSILFWKKMNEKRKIPRLNYRIKSNRIESNRVESGRPNELRFRFPFNRKRKTPAFHASVKRGGEGEGEEPSCVGEMGEKKTVQIEDW